MHEHVTLPNPRISPAVRPVMPRHEPSILDLESFWRAHSGCVESDISRTPDDELIGLSEELETELLLLCADLEARDFSYLPESILHNTISYLEAQLREVTHQLERRTRVRKRFATTGVDVREVMEPRWRAVRALDIVEALQTLGVPLRKRGREWWACCPFHDEQTPSFAVNQDKGVWRCHRCQLGGDLITFIQLKQHASRAGALRFAEGVLLGEAA